MASSFNLHVLRTPPAFILSQDQTLSNSFSCLYLHVKAALDEAGGLFRELGLTQEQGQRLIDLHAKHWLGGC